MIIENSQRFSPRLTRADLFTRSVMRLKVTDLVRQTVHYLGDLEHIADVQIWIGFEESGLIKERPLQLTLKSQSCRFGGSRWWAACPRCRKYAAILYLADGFVACRKCHRLKYLSQVCSDAPRLMNHYARLREDIDRRPGPRPKRYWRYLAKEDFYVRKVMDEMKKWAASKPFRAAGSKQAF